jgi:hypothetical protein
MLAARGVAPTTAPAGWTKLARIAQDTMDAWPRFLKAEHAETLATRLATTYEPASWWIVRYVHPHAPIEERAEEWRVRVWPDGRPLDVRHVLPDAAWRDSVGADDARASARAAMARAGLDTARYVEADLVTDKKAADSTKAQRKDVTLTYTDTTIHLPGGALARAWVSIAGNEVTLVRRGVELPESFRRADRKKQMMRGAIAGGVLLLLVGFVIGGATYARNRRRAVLDDRYFTKRRAIVAALLLGALSLASSLNGLPTHLASYDTAETWRAFLANTVLTSLGSLILVAFIVGLWMAFDGLRRRVGIPLFPHDEAPWPNTVAAAIGLAGLQAAIGGVSAWFATPGIPDAPATSLESAIPVFTGALSLPLAIAAGVMFVAIPALVILLLVRTTRARIALTLALGALGGGAVLAVGGRTPSTHPFLLAALALVSLPAMFCALRAYAATSAATWALCVTLQMALGATRSAIDAPTLTERIGAVVTLAALAGIVLLVRRLVAVHARPPAG